MDESKAKVVDWYLVFSSSKLDHWVMKLLKPEFQHVKAYRLSDEGYFWIEVNPRSAVTEVEMHPVSRYPHISTLCSDSDTILPVRARIDENYRGTLCWFNCVEVVKSLIGVKAFWCWTPYQLYRRLKNG